MALTSIVVVPARDEERRIANCLRALAEQTVGPGAFEVVLVLDRCRDATETIAVRAAARLGLQLTTVTGPGRGPGAARRLGMELAAERLHALGCPGGLIATTDADSAAAPDWLERQLAHLAAGAEAVAGLIELDSDEGAGLPPAVLARRACDAERRLARVRRADAAAGHHHFAGASIGITAAAYARVGGLEPLPALEDAAFATRLARAGVPVLRPVDVRVRTSARADGRVSRGLSVDLEVSLWRERNRFAAADFDLGALAAARDATGTTVTVIIPTKQCAETIGGVLTETVAPLQQAGLVDQVVVIDAGSPDGTAAVAAACGAEVLQQDALAPEHGPALGKGDAMWRALAATDGELVCFLDGDTADPSPLHLLGLLGPLLTRADIRFVKGAFERPLRRGDQVSDHEGGRVTELMARPLINLHQPRLAGFAQPLAGEFAAHRELLEAMPFPVGYGVEIAVLIDALRREGLAALAESDLGRRQNRHQSLRALGEMAFAVLAAAERRRGPGHEVISDSYVRPWEDGASHAVAIEERPPLASLSAADRVRHVDGDLASSV
ncbi:MAG TPA: glucosyl-3-phosphoglycerate synthase [Solirubrobacteraceae bacterium]|nr:glucosyl-3-phosphoglycerate synthase [Solirubrobacteraceae bacterium]